MYVHLSAGQWVFTSEKYVDLIHADIRVIAITRE